VNTHDFQLEKLDVSEAAALSFRGIERHRYKSIV
jgi:hypothetical protein